MRANGVLNRLGHPASERHIRANLLQPAIDQWHIDLAAAKKAASDAAMATVTVGSALYLIGGSVAVGAVAVAVPLAAAGAAYGLYSLYTYATTSATNSAVIG